MPDKTYLVQFKPSSQFGVQTVVASTAEIYDEHLVFCDSDGKPIALLLLEFVQSWNEIPSPSNPSDQK